jgi:hypothetical protein
MSPDTPRSLSSATEPAGLARLMVESPVFAEPCLGDRDDNDICRGERGTPGGTDPDARRGVVGCCGPRREPADDADDGFEYRPALPVVGGRGTAACWGADMVGGGGASIADRG